MSISPPTPGLLRGEKFAMLSWLSTAPTAMIDVLLAGTPTNPKLPMARLALFPAAAMIRQPWSSAR